MNSPSSSHRTQKFDCHAKVGTTVSPSRRGRRFRLQIMKMQQTPRHVTKPGTSMSNETGIRCTKVNVRQAGIDKRQGSHGANSIIQLEVHKSYHS